MDSLLPRIAGRSKGVPRGITLGCYLRSSILLIVLSAAISFIPVLSSSSTARNHDLESLAGNLDIYPLPCPNKWIAKPYFEYFETLLDSHFQDFLEHGLSPCSCEASVGALTTELKLSGLARNLIGEGSHRRLSSSIRMNVGEKFKVNPSAYSCEAIVIERLPSGIFADPFELQHLLECGVYNDVAVFGDTDLELPTVRSNRTVVEIHMDVSPNTLSRHKHELEINLQIPLHVRYPPLDESEFVKIAFEEPDILARCSIDGRPSDQTCLSVVMRDNVKTNGSPVAWEVPSGIERHAGIVSTGTFVSATLSAVLIILASTFHSDAKSHLTVKRS